MRNTVAYLAVSLDGVIATTEEGLAWLEETEGEGDNGYQALLDSIDTVMMGRTTYDWIVRNAAEYPYKGKQSFILTHREICDENPVTAIRSLEETLAELKRTPGKNIWLVGGGKLISQLLNQGLVDELRLTIAPVLLGSGIPLFTGLKEPVSLHLTKTVQYGQFIELDYTVKKEPG